MATTKWFKACTRCKTPYDKFTYYCPRCGCPEFSIIQQDLDKMEEQVKADAEVIWRTKAGSP